MKFITTSKLWTDVVLKRLFMVWAGEEGLSNYDKLLALESANKCSTFLEFASYYLAAYEAKDHKVTLRFYNTLFKYLENCEIESLTGGRLTISKTENNQLKLRFDHVSHISSNVLLMLMYLIFVTNPQFISFGVLKNIRFQAAITTDAGTTQELSIGGGYQWYQSNPPSLTSYLQHYLPILNDLDQREHYKSVKHLELLITTVRDMSYNIK